MCCNTSSDQYVDSPAARDQIRLVDSEQGAIPKVGEDNLNRSWPTYSILGDLRCLPSTCSARMQNQPTFYPLDGRTNTTHCCRVGCTGDPRQDFAWWGTGMGSTCEPESGEMNGNRSPYCLATPTPSPTPCPECDRAYADALPVCSPDQGDPLAARSLPVGTPSSCTPQTCATPTPVSTPGRVVLTESDMRQRVSYASLKVAPCHMIGASPERSFPASQVMADGEEVWSPCFRGRCDSFTYGRQRFFNIEHQYYKPGEKIYYMALFYKGGPNEFSEDGESLEDREVFVGWQSYRVRKKWEIYDPTKPAHTQITRFFDRQNGDSRPPRVADGEITPYVWRDFESSAGARRQEVVYEMCYKVNDPEDYRVRRSPGDEPFGGSDDITYTAGDSPTLLGHLKTVRQDLEPFIRHMSELHGTLTFVWNATPLIGTACSAYSCLQQPNLVCLSEVGLDVTSDALMLVALGIPARLTKVAAAAKLAQYATIPPNLALAAYHGARDDWGRALGRAIQPGVDLGVLAYGRGAIRYRSLGQKSKNLPCSTCQGELRAGYDPQEICELRPAPCNGSQCNPATGGLPDEEIGREILRLANQLKKILGRVQISLDQFTSLNNEGVRRLHLLSRMLEQDDTALREILGGLPTRAQSKVLAESKRRGVRLTLSDGGQDFALPGEAVVRVKMLDSGRFIDREFKDIARRIVLHELAHSAIQDNGRSLLRRELFPGYSILHPSDSQWRVLTSEMEADMYAGSSLRQAFLDVISPGRYGRVLDVEYMFGPGWRSMSDRDLLSKLRCGDSSLEWDFPFVFGNLP